MIHELAHAKLHSGERDLRLSSEEKEFRAELVAYSTTSYFNIDTSDYSLRYLANWTKGKELNDKELLLNEVKETSVEFVQSIEKELLKGKEIEKEQKHDKPSVEIQEWANKMELEHSSTDNYDEFISHSYVCKDSLIYINESYDNSNYQVFASK